jgi:hypothetical protein
VIEHVSPTDVCLHPFCERSNGIGPNGLLAIVPEMDRVAADSAFGLLVQSMGTPSCWITGRAIVTVVVARTVPDGETAAIATLVCGGNVPEEPQAFSNGITAKIPK